MEHAVLVGKKGLPQKRKQSNLTWSQRGHARKKTGENIPFRRLGSLRACTPAVGPQQKKLLQKENWYMAVFHMVRAQESSYNRFAGSLEMTSLTVNREIFRYILNEKV